jgi:UDP-N-acetyl-2-amino-2-deoxyglucuronate dehydrogenase
MSVGFGIIGLGMIAKFHALALKAADGGRLAACYSRSRDKAIAFAGEYGCRGYSSLSEFLADPELEVVSICTPSGAHMEPALEAARAGKHLLVEKPMEVTLERCDAIIEACRQKGVLCAGIFPTRFWEPAILIKEAIDASRFGRLSMGGAYAKYYRSQEYYDSGGWHGTWKYDGGGAVMNQGIHAIDLLQWYMGPVERVRAVSKTLGHTNIEVEDAATAMLEFKNGALGIIECSTAVFPGYQKKIEIGGTEGSVILVQDKLEAWSFASKTERDKEIWQKHSGASKTGWGASDPGNVNTLGHQRQIEDLINAVEKKQAPLVTGEEARKAVEIVLAIYRSSRTDRPVTLPV